MFNMLISLLAIKDAGIIFPAKKNKTNLMTQSNSSKATKKLALRFILENIDFRKRSLYLQEIISLGRINDVWRKALATFFDTPFNNFSLKSFSKN
jgi:hypothetical protein